MNKKIKEFFIIIVGFIVLLFYIVFKKQGSGKFYIKAQEDNLLNKFIKSKILNFLFSNFKYYESNIIKEISDEAMLYRENTQTLKKYTAHDYGQRESIELEEQKRGLGIPLIKNLLKNDKIKNVMEIGTGNGDLISFIAKEYSNKYFTGIDFNVETAKEKHKLDNLNFIHDYALNHLNKADVDNIDLIFADSTFIYFTPKELIKYVKIFLKKCKFIIITDPTWYGIHKKKFIKDTYHLEGGVFFHNYNHYLKDFDILQNKFLKYKHKISPRPDIYINIILAKNNILVK
jgi:SAM-dependent methyltransferase